MILTLLPNPALDKTVVILGFSLGAIHRPDDVVTLAGGKGFNFARALRTLGEAVVVTPLAGFEGRRLESLAEREGVSVDGVEVEGELRTCLSVIDPTSGNHLMEIYERGAPLREGAWKRLVACAVARVSQARFLAVCGSFPLGVPEHGLRDVVAEAVARCLPVLLDTAGRQTLDALDLRPELLRVNASEAASLLVYEVTTPGRSNLLRAGAASAWRALSRHLAGPGRSRRRDIGGRDVWLDGPASRGAVTGGQRRQRVRRYCGGTRAVNRFPRPHVWAWRPKRRIRCNDDQYDTLGLDFARLKPRYVTERLREFSRSPSTSRTSREAGRIRVTRPPTTERKLSTISGQPPRK